MQIGLMLLVVMLVLVLLGMPIAFAVGFASMCCILSGGYQIIIIPQKLFAGIDSFVLLAIPFFMLAGNIMANGGITRRILDFASAAFGWLKGSLAIITVIASAIFAALTGSGVATVSGIGGITIPAMKEEGYEPEFAAAVASNSAILGPLIPPSIFMIVYGNAAEVDISSLFKAGLIPGITLAVLLALYCHRYAKKHDLKSSNERFEWKNVLVQAKKSFWALLMPVLLLGVIFGGVCTPTEAASVACVYAIVIAVFVYRMIDAKKLFEIFKQSGLVVATTMIIMGTSKISGWVLTFAKVPTTIANAILGASSSSFMIILLINLFLILVGMFMEANAAIVILTPILLPIVTKCGMSPLQFGTVLCTNLCMGLITPPVGGCLTIGNEIAHARLEKTFVRCLPFLAIEAIVLTLVNAVPAFSTWLPSL